MLRKIKIKYFIIFMPSLLFSQIDSLDYDYAFVGQASIIDKKVSLKKSINKGLEFL